MSQYTINHTLPAEECTCNHVPSMHYGLTGDCALCDALGKPPCISYTSKYSIKNQKEESLPIVFLWEK